MSAPLPLAAVTLHMIGNAHLDPVWLWQWPEGLQEAKATFRSALDRMAETPEFVFTSSSAAIYEWVEENDPAIFREIQARVAEGRWTIAGGWWIQPDCNIPAGESYVRQALYGQRYFQEKFGLIATVGYNVDSFGHNAMLPQILAKGGMDSYVFMRPEPIEKELPGRLFWWEAADGSRVLTFRIPYAYTAGGTTEELEAHVLRCAAEATAEFPEIMCFYGVGNHGGGPTRDNLRRIPELDADPAFPHLIHGSPRDYFDRVLAADLDLPVVRGDLLHHASGCYAAHSGVKRWNRQAENLLLAAEKWSSIATAVLDRPYPRADLTHAWKQVLFNQFHDILAGTSLASAYDDARDTYGEAIAVARRRLQHAIQAVAWQIDIPFTENTTPIVVFNPHAWPVTAGVELEFGRFAPTDGLTDDTGAAVPIQTVRSEATVSGWRHRLCFSAQVPPMGYRVYRVGPTSSARHHADPSLETTPTSIENGFLRLEIDPASGVISSLFDKRRGVETVRGGAARPVVIADPSDTWSHGVFRFDQIAGQFAPTSVALVETGPVRAVLRVQSAYAASTLRQDFILSAGSDQIEVRVTVDWRERFQMLKLLFGLNLDETSTTYEIPYGTIERAESGDEQPGQAWVDMTGHAPGSADPSGLTVLNDTKYSMHTTPGEIGLTVLRSPIVAHHDPYVPRPGGDYEFLDQGIQRFAYALVPHAGDWRAAGATRRAAALNQPLIPLAETFHPGPLPLAREFLAAEPANIVVSALKRAEDGEDIIVRAYETAGVATAATLRLPAWDRTVETTFTPYEIKTLRLPSDRSLPPRETDLIEWG